MVICLLLSESLGVLNIHPYIKKKKERKKERMKKRKKRSVTEVRRAQIGTLHGEEYTGAVGRPIDPSWGGPIALFLVPASGLRLV